MMLMTDTKLWNFKIEDVFSSSTKWNRKEQYTHKAVCVTQYDLSAGQQEGEQRVKFVYLHNDFGQLQTLVDFMDGCEDLVLDITKDPDPTKFFLANGIAGKRIESKDVYKFQFPVNDAWLNSSSDYFRQQECNTINITVSTKTQIEIHVHHQHSQYRFYEDINPFVWTLPLWKYKGESNTIFHQVRRILKELLKEIDNGSTKEEKKD